MPVMISLDDDLIPYFEEHGKFGETHSDVLRRLLPGFNRGTASLVPSKSAAVLTSPSAIRSEKPAKTESRREHYPPLFGHSLTSIVRALGAAGWSEEQVVQALRRRSIEPNPAMIRTQIGWGKQWGK